MSNSKSRARKKAIVEVNKFLEKLRTENNKLPQNTTVKDIEPAIFMLLGMQRYRGCPICGHKNVPRISEIDPETFENDANFKKFVEIYKEHSHKYTNRIIILEFVCKKCKNISAVGVIVKKDWLYGGLLIRPEKPEWDVDYLASTTIGRNIPTPASWFDSGWRIAKTTLQEPETS